MARKKKTEPNRPIESYEHRDKQRLNNPPVGLLTPETDPDAGQQKKTYTYDPHLDPLCEAVEFYQHQRIAVKIVDDRGIESLMVLELTP